MVVFERACHGGPMTFRLDGFVAAARSFAEEYADLVVPEAVAGR